MRILFATSNPNKVEESSVVLELSGHRVEQLLIGGVPPDFKEPKELGLEAVAMAKIEQALELIHGTEFEGSAIMVEDSGVFLDAFENWPGAASSDIEREIGLEGRREVILVTTIGPGSREAPKAPKPDRNLFLDVYML